MLFFLILAEKTLTVRSRAVSAVLFVSAGRMADGSFSLRCQQCFSCVQEEWLTVCSCCGISSAFRADRKNG